MMHKEGVATRFLKLDAAAALVLQEDDSNKFSEMQDDVLPKTKQEPKEVKVNGIILHSPEKEGYKMNNAFAKQFERTQSINDLLDLATISNLSTYNALKLISRITNQINSGESQIVDIEADERFIHLRKIVKAGNDIKTGTKQMNDDLVHYSQLSTPAMIAVSGAIYLQVPCTYINMRYIACMCVYVCNFYILLHQGDGIVARTKKQKYTAVKDAVVQYREI